MMKKLLSTAMVAVLLGLAPATWAQDGNTAQTEAAQAAAVESAPASTEATPTAAAPEAEAAVAEAAPTVAEPAPTLDSGNTARMLTSLVLVLFMIIPGLALFYVGMVRTKNVLRVMMQCFAITSLVTIRGEIGRESGRVRVLP